MKYYLLAFSFALFLLLGCGGQPNANNTVAVNTITPTKSAPELSLNVTETTPNQQIVVQGQGFAPNAVVVLYYAESETNLGPAVAQTISSGKGDFQVELLAPTAWPGADFRGETRLMIVAETADSSEIASTPIVIEYQGAITRFENEDAGYALDIPSDWGSTDSQMTPLGNLILLGPTPLYPGSPSNSIVISVDTQLLDDVGAAQSLICGSPGCTEDIAFSVTKINGLDAKSLIVGTEETADLEWFFITHDDKLYYFTLHDPLTLETVDPLVESFSIIDRISAAAEEPTAESVSEATPEATPTEESEESEDSEVEVAAVSAEPTVAETSTAEADATEAVEAPTPTETSEPTASPTPEPTETPAETPTPSATPTATPTSILLPTKTPVNSPTPTVEPTATIELNVADPTTIGPLQTSLDLLTVLSLSAETRDTLSYFSEAAIEQVGGPSNIRDFLKLERKPFAFQAERVQGIAPPVVRIFVQSYINGPVEVIDLEMVQEEGRWKVNSSRLVQEPTATPAATEAETGSETEEETGE